jgi:hypothetical protein
MFSRVFPIGFRSNLNVLDNEYCRVKLSYIEFVFLFSIFILPFHLYAKKGRRLSPNDNAYQTVKQIGTVAPLYQKTPRFFTKKKRINAFESIIIGCDLLIFAYCQKKSNFSLFFTKTDFAIPAKLKNV